MINALTRKDNDLIVAKWFPQNQVKGNGKIIKVKIYTEWRKQTEQPIQNLRVNSETTQLETKYNYDFEVNDNIYFDGSWWLVTGVACEYRKAKEKSLALARVAYAEKYTRLAIIKVGGSNE